MLHLQKLSVFEGCKNAFYMNTSTNCEAGGGLVVSSAQIPIRKVRPGGGGCVVDRVAGLTMATATKQQQIRSSGQRNAGSAGRVNGAVQCCGFRTRQ